RERTRLLDAYQAGLLELDDLTRRAAAITARRDQLAQEKDTLTRRSAELATENRLRRRLAGFAESVAASLDDLDVEGRRQLLRLVVEKVRVTGWRVEIHLKIPLPEDPSNDDPDPTEPAPDGPLSSDMRLRSLRGEDAGVVQEAVQDGGRDGRVFEDRAPVGDPPVRREHDAAVFVAAADDLEEMRGCFAGHREVAQLVNDEELWSGPEAHRVRPAPVHRRA